MFNQEILGDIRDRIPIVSLIGERIPLKKAGRNHRGLCPFHQEKTPSFMVSDEKQIYHCFGCGEGGDVFKFLMKFEGLSFAEAVRTLAERAGVTLPKDTYEKGPDEELARKKKWCYRLNQIAQEYFHACLKGPSGLEARNYLKTRGIKEQTWTQLFLGYAEKGWDGLIRHLEEKKAPLELAEELGLIKRKSGSQGHYDFFRFRLMFPIVSPRGEIIGFSGRTLEENDKETAKYLNSPDSLIYHKSNCVFGLNLAADAVRKTDQVIIVEGNIDLVSLFQSGVTNVVAPLGTALTGGHIRMLSRYTKNFVVVFDGDDAGSKAAVRSLPLFLEAGFAPRAAAMPEAEDPDSFVRKNGAEKFRELTLKAPTLFEHVTDVIASRAGDDTAGRIKAMQEIVPLLRQVGDPAAEGMYLSCVAKRLKVKDEIVRDAVRGKNVKLRMTSADAAKKGAGDAARSAPHTAERVLVETIIGMPKLIEDVAQRVETGQFEDRSLRTIMEMLLADLKKGGGLNISRLLASVADPELEAELRAMAMDTKDIEESEAVQAVEDCLGTIEKRPLAEKIDNVNEAIREAESEGNETLLFELLAKKRDLAQEARK